MLTTFFVDGAAAAGGDGTAAAPFNTIQHAVDAAVEAAGGDTISISPGQYVENVEIKDAGDLTILGHGATVTSAGNDNRTIDVDDSGEIVIWDLTITGAESDGLRVRDSDSLTLEGVVLTGNGDEGLQTADVPNVILRGVHAMHNAGDGIAIEEANGEIGVLILVASVRRNGDDGVQIELSDRAAVSQLNAGDNQGDGLNVDGLADLTITKSQFWRNDDGIDIAESERIRIENVKANGNADEGLEVDDSGSIVVDGGVFNNNGEAGLDIDDVVRIAVMHVTSNHNGEHGLQIESEDDGDAFAVIASVLITNSVFSNNIGDGIQIVESGTAAVTSVVISGVNANSNSEIDDEDGGHGLFIDIGGTLVLSKITANNNPRGNLPPV